MITKNLLPSELVLTLGGILTALLLVSGCTKSTNENAESETKPAQSPDWEALLVEGSSNSNQFGSFTLRLTNVAELVVTSGKLVACDGFVFDSHPLTAEFPLGKFPVQLAVAQFSNDQRVAAATVQFNTNAAVRWEFCGSYGVDSGTGCYLDVTAAKLLEKRTEREPNFFMTLLPQMEKQQVNTWSWLNLAVDETSGLNAVLFSSGFGDGGYNCFVGYDSAGKPAKLVTDFGILNP